MLVPSCPTMHRARPTLLLLLPPLLLVQGLLLHLADAQTPPKFLRTPNDQTGVQGGVASFICQATGDPRPKIVWNKKGKKVTNQRFEVIEFDDGSGSVLRIQPLRTPRDEAIYECVASNTVGEISASTRLTVLRDDQLPPGFPTIDMGPQLKVVERTRTATMLCAASGNPDPDISWFKDFLPVNTSNNNGRIKQLRSESFGKCLALKHTSPPLISMFQQQLKCMACILLTDSLVVGLPLQTHSLPSPPQCSNVPPLSAVAT
uniref:Protein tyrosine phosphatase receptor type D n=1 Tax=Oryzias latipes TaxID=8090 RepID=A0A3P9MDG0_ORYLA